MSVVPRPVSPQTSRTPHTAAAIRCRVRCDTTGRSGRALWTRRKSVKTTSHIGHRGPAVIGASSQSGPPNRRKISGAAAAPLQCESQRNTAGGPGAAAGTVRSGRRGYIISALVCLRSVSLRRAATRVTRCRAATGARTLSRHARPRRAGPLRVRPVGDAIPRAEPVRVGRRDADDAIVGGPSRAYALC